MLPIIYASLGDKALGALRIIYASLEEKAFGVFPIIYEIPIQTSNHLDIDTQYNEIIFQNKLLEN